ncbi:MAG: hypothetical protein ACKOQ3_00995 [Novosphingobium sp.]
MTGNTQSTNIEQLADVRLGKLATTLRDRIRAAEASGDQMLEDSAALLKDMVAARRLASVDPHTGQRAIMRMAKVTQTIIAAQNDMFRVHEELVSIQTKMMPDEYNSTPPHGISESEIAAFEATTQAA